MRDGACGPGHDPWVSAPGRSVNHAPRLGIRMSGRVSASFAATGRGPAARQWSLPMDEGGRSAFTARRQASSPRVTRTHPAAGRSTVFRGLGTAHAVNDRVSTPIPPVMSPPRRFTPLGVREHRESCPRPTRRVLCPCRVRAHTLSAVTIRPVRRQARRSYPGRSRRAHRPEDSPPADPGRRRKHNALRTRCVGTGHAARFPLCGGRQRVPTAARTALRAIAQSSCSRRSSSRCSSPAVGPPACAWPPCTGDASRIVRCTAVS